MEPHILDAAARELASLDAKVARRVTSRIHWLAENWQDAKAEALSGDLAGLFKLRVGDYRVIYQVLEAESLLLIHAIGHRREVYRRK
jgi:mRNA interferase RelE/StbE